MSTRVVALDVLGVAAIGDAIRVEVRLALELGDPQGDLVGVPELLVGVLEELAATGPALRPSAM